MSRARFNRRIWPAAALTCALALAEASPASAQSWAKFDVPDSLLPATLKSNEAQFENLWNALFVATLRAHGGPADSLQRLRGLARRTATAETSTLKSTIGSDALGRAEHWSAAQRRARIAAAVEESLATVAQSTRAYERADSLFGSALARYRRIPEPRRTAWVLGSLGVVAFLAGDLVRADSVYREALTARRALGDAKMIGNTLNALGSTNYLLRRDSTSLAYFEQARTVREGTGERAALGSTLNYMGLVTMRLGQLDRADRYFRDALELTVATGDSGRTADVLTNWIGLQTQRGETQRVLELAERARTIYRSRNSVGDEAQLDLNVGNLLVLEGRFSAAASRLENALELSRQARDVRGEMRVLLSLGHLAVVVQDPERWDVPLRRGVALSDSLGDVSAQAASRNNMAALALYADDRAGAERLAQDALRRARAAGDSGLVHDVATTLGNVAFVGRDTAAASWYRIAEAAGRDSRSSVRASDFNNLATAAILAGRLDEAEEHFHTALAIAETDGLIEWTWPPLLGLGEVAERRGDFPTALGYGRRAASLIGTLRSGQAESQAITLFARRLFAFEALIHLLGKLDSQFPDSSYAEEAFGWAERARARTLLDLMSGAGGRSSSLTPVTLSQAQRALPSGTVLLEYSLGDSSSSLWVLTRDDARYVRLPARPALRTRIQRLRLGLADPEQATSEATMAVAHDLYRVLVEPAEPLLRGHKHVIVSPDGPVALVPFEALMVRPSHGRPQAADYLVNRLAVSYTPSMSTLIASGTPSAVQGVVALADPTFAGDSSRSELPRLPNTVAEVEALRNAVRGRTVVSLIGSDATRTRLLDSGLERSSIIHLATHGEADELDPARSGLWLAAENGRPGYLAVPDVLALKLDADLVTLSACETGLGRLERGEGVLGLARAFMAAGSRSVVVSLWKVNDLSTAELMGVFYKRLLSKGASRDDALAEAKRALMRDRNTASPFHWAPFVLSGQSGVVH